LRRCWIVGGPRNRAEVKSRPIFGGRRYESRHAIFDCAARIACNRGIPKSGQVGRDVERDGICCLKPAGRTTAAGRIGRLAQQSDRHGGGAGVGGLLNGGLGELLERFKQNGQGDAAQSWIDDGPNKEISPPQLKQAIGQDVLAALEQQTGLSQDELLARLSRELPAAVDKYTPSGRLPDQNA